MKAKPMVDNEEYFILLLQKSKRAKVLYEHLREAKRSRLNESVYRKMHPGNVNAMGKYERF